MNIRRKFLAACVAGVAVVGLSTGAHAQQIQQTNQLRLVNGAHSLTLMPPTGGGDQTLTFPVVAPGSSFIMSSSLPAGTGQSLINGLAFTGSPLTASNALLSVTPTIPAVDGTYYGLRSVTSSGTSGLISVVGVFGNATGTDDAATGAVFSATGTGTNTGAQISASGGTVANTGLTVSATGTGALGLNVTAGGASVTGGIDNNTGGITEAGAISGATGVTSSGAITFSGLSTLGVVHNSAAGLLSTSLIVDGDVSNTAAIAGSKINPAFGAQAISNNGPVTFSALATGPVKSTAGVLSASAIDLNSGSSEISGTLSVARGGTGVTTATANTVFAGPALGAAAAPGFRALVAADIPAGSTNYIQNQNAGAQASANFNIDGAGTIGTTLTVTGAATFNGAVTLGNGLDVITLNGTASANATINEDGLDVASGVGETFAFTNTAAGVMNVTADGAITAANGLAATAGGLIVSAGNTFINSGGSGGVTIGNNTSGITTTLHGGAINIQGPGGIIMHANLGTTDIANLVGQGGVTIGNTGAGVGNVTLNKSASGNIVLGGLASVANPTHVATLTAGGAVGSTAIADFNDNWIQNQNAGAQASANFNISGNGTIGGIGTVTGAFNANGGATVTGGDLVVGANMVAIDDATGNITFETSANSHTISKGGNGNLTIATGGGDLYITTDGFQVLSNFGLDITQASVFRSNVDPLTFDDDVIISGGTLTVGNAATFNSTAAHGANLVSGSNFDIDGGAIDGTPIGANSASTGEFTTLEATAGLTVTGTVTLPAGSIENVDLANDEVTINTGTGLTGGGAVALGSSLNLAVNLGDFDTDDLSEGATNLYYTDARVSSVNLGGDLSGTVGNATIDAGVVGSTQLADDAVTYAKLQNVAASSLVGNATAGAADATDIALGAGLEFSGSSIVVDDDVIATDAQVTSALSNYLALAGGTMTGSIVSNTDVGGDLTINEEGLSRAGDLALTSTTGDVNITADDANSFGVNIVGDVGMNGTLDVGSTIWTPTGDIGTGSGNLRATSGSLIFEGSGQNIRFGADGVDGTLNFIDGDVAPNVLATLTDDGTNGTLTVANFAGNLTGNASGTAANVTGTVAVANGGTGVAALTQDGVLIGNGVGNVTASTNTTINTTRYLTQTNVAGVVSTPTWTAVAGGGTAGNGLTANGGAIDLGGTLTASSTITTTAAFTLSVDGAGTFAVQTANASMSPSTSLTLGTLTPTINIGTSTSANTLRGTIAFDVDDDVTAGENTIFAFTNVGGGNQTITFPDATGTVALTSDLTGYVALSGTNATTTIDRALATPATIALTNSDVTVGAVANLTVDGSVSAAGALSSNTLNATGSDKFAGRQTITGTGLVETVYTITNASCETTSTVIVTFGTTSSGDQVTGTVQNILGTGFDVRITADLDNAETMDIHYMIIN